MRIFAVVIAPLLSHLLPLAEPLAQAREIQWGAELSTDAALAAYSVGVARAAPDSARESGASFPTQALDDGAHQVFHGRNPAPAVNSSNDRAWRTASNVSVVGAAAFPAVAALGAYDDNTFGRILTTGHALLMGNAAVTTLKVAVRRPRPSARTARREDVTGDQALSFPSGHSSAAFSGATLVSCFFPEAPLVVRGGAFALAAFTAVARMAGNKHYLSDVVVGGGIGAGAAVLAHNLYENPASSVSFGVAGHALTLAIRL